MLPIPLASRSVHLRESYIEISNYIRVCYATKPQRQSYLRHSARYLSTTARLEQDTTSLEADKILDQYKKHGFNQQALHSFESLETLFARGPKARPWKSRKTYNISIYGYITSSRKGGKGLTFLTLVDPYMRKSIQLLVNANVKPDGNGNNPKAKDGTNQANVEGNNADQRVPSDTAEGTADKDSSANGEALGMNSRNGDNPKAKNETDNVNVEGNDIGQRVPSETADQITDTDSPANTKSIEKNGHEDITVQKQSISQEEAQKYLQIRPHTPVLVTGIVRRHEERAAEISSEAGGVIRKIIKGNQPVQRVDPFVGRLDHMVSVEIEVDHIAILNSFPSDRIAKQNTTFSPKERHLQFRTSSELRYMIRARSKAAAETRKFMFTKGFEEIETPLLFKSTPEGAREFIVPTRQKGMAYALPQSPQQYKQLLMASGIHRYFQLARCFRDEDMRADRQPEFTQLDLEMSFAGREDVMKLIERLIVQTLWPPFSHKTPYADELEEDPPFKDKFHAPEAKFLFPQITYHDAMTAWGSDKPDLRLGSKISRIDEIVSEDLIKMLTGLEKPIVEMMKIDMEGNSAVESGEFITDFLDSASSAGFLSNPAGAPGITVFDPTKPLEGLASFGFEGAERIKELFKPNPGDILVAQARPDVRFSGGSTALGNLRRDINQAAVSQGLKKVPKDTSFLWVVDFPLFSPVNDVDPGQGGEAGICSTHHPFTAPKTTDDVDLLLTDPLSVIGDHYDLVINGVEIGGGSRRIHDSKMQELIFRDVLKMKPERVEDFRHLLDALAAGCPPHAGIALGFDRLMALLLRKTTVKDVIAFPKSGNGEDRMVGAPSLMTEEQAKTYHMDFRGGTTPEADAEAGASTTTRRSKRSSQTSGDIVIDATVPPEGAIVI